MTTPPPSDLANDPLLRDVPDVDGWKVLDPAILFAKIGQGGMGAVYRGRHVELEIDVAVKCLKPSLVAEDAQFEARFRREARLAAELTHENLVRLYELRRSHGLSYLILEFVDGETARDRVVRKGPLGEQEACGILLGVARGLAKAHRHREVIVHRDIKPENILISKTGEVKVADLGIAKAMESDGGTLSTQGFLGTPAYTAPEQWEDSSLVGPATDVWAAGVTLYFLLTGRTAVRTGTVHQISYEICNRAFPDVRALRSDVSADVLRILTRCTQRDPKARYADAADLARDLEAFLQGQMPSLSDRDSGSVKSTMPLFSPPPAHALKQVRLARSGKGTGTSGETAPASGAGSAAGRSTTPAAPATGAPRGSRRVPALWAAGAIAAVALVALGYVFWPRSDDSETRDGAGAPSGSRTSARNPTTVDSTLRAQPANAALVSGSTGGSVDATSASAATRIALDTPLRDGLLYTRDLNIVLAGQVRDAATPSLRLKRGGRTSTYPIESEGRFTIDLGLRRDARETIELALDEGSSLSFTLVQDSKPPQIELLAPGPTARRTNSLSIEVRARLDDPEAARCFVGASEMQAGSDGVWSAPAVELVAGENALVVVAEDLAGNRSTLPFSVRCDARGPALLSSVPPSGARVDIGTRVRVELAFDESPKVARLAGEAAAIAEARVSADLVVPAGEGPWRIAWSVEDDLANATSGQLVLERAVRRIARIVLDPSLPEGNVVYSRETKLDLRGRIEDASGESVRVEIAGRGSNHALGPQGALEVTSLTLPRDQRSAVALVHGTGESATRLEFEVVQDSLDPVLEFTRPDPAGRLTNRDAIDLSLRVTESNLAWVRLGSRELEAGPSDTWTAEGVALESEGSNTLVVTARDRVGREARASIEVVRDTLAPRLVRSEPPADTVLEAGAAVPIALEFDGAVASGKISGQPGEAADARLARASTVPAGEGSFEVPWSAIDRAGNAANGILRYARRSKPKVRPPEGWEIVDAAPGHDGWARKVKEPRSGITFVLIAPGTFQMGSPAGEEGRSGEEQQHPVEITRAFYLAETETTQQQYERVAGSNPSYFKGPTLPVESVDWTQSRAFCQQIGCDLPTEAQWEFACRAGTRTPFSFGPTISTDQANYDGNYTYGSGRKGTYRIETVPARTFPANAWGLHEMHGNVWEWCVDGHRADFQALSRTDPVQEPSGDTRVLRGGSWFNFPVNCRAANRYWFAPAFRTGNVGFRVARTL